MTEGGGKVAPVTGGGRRIGAAISRAFAKAGYTVVLTHRGSSREGRSPAARIGWAAVTLDLSRPSTFGRFGDRPGRGIGSPEGVARADLRFARAGKYNA
jgi:NAD(P)-dependent dehydrogenase (short-subunit alcohol dehydrogenase family)